MEYAFGKEVAMSYDEAVAKVTEELKKVGFGILTTIDVKKTLKEKLDRDFNKYVILGACNPDLAFRALKTETEVGLLLPCNVIVYETDKGRTRVAFSNAKALMRVVGDDRPLQNIANQANELLKQAMANL